ncbi:MAG: CPBP family intramembrane metalloprotease [Clostridiaceae bacterium]|nr:CPBP family intramembrane metalloprotease [Clostridiaceae bacterium]
MMNEEYQQNEHQDQTGLNTAAESDAYNQAQLSDPGAAYYHGEQGRINLREPRSSSDKRFSPKTVLIPLGFMILHFLVINIVAIVVLIIALIIGSGGALDLNTLADPDYINKLIIERNSQITVFYALALLPVYLIYMYFARRKRPDTVYIKRAGILDLLPSIAIMIGTMGLTNLYFVLLTQISETNSFIARLMQDYEELSSLAFSTETDYLWLILGIGIAAPVVEELLFRGIIQGELRHAMPEWVAVIIQAVLFAAFHMQPIQSSYVIIPGLMLGAAYAWSKSLWVPIIMHIFFNLLGSLVPSLIQSDEMLQQIVIISEVAFIPIAIAAGIFMFLRSRKRKIDQNIGGSSVYEPSL